MDRPWRYWTLSAAFNRDDKYKPGIGDLTGGIATNTNYMYGILESSAQGGTVSADWMLDETFDISLLYDIKMLSQQNGLMSQAQCLLKMQQMIGQLQIMIFFILSVLI